MAELASLTRLRERLVIAGLLNRAADLLYGEGRAAALALTAHSTRPRVERTHVLRLGALAEQTASVSVLLDYVQVQTGKRAEWRQEDFGPRLLRALAELQGRAESLAAEAREQGVSSDDLSRTLHLELARRFVRHFIASYVAGPPAQAQPQRQGEIARPAPAGPARGPSPERRQAPGPQATQARRPVGARPPRPEQPSEAMETREPAPSTPMQEAAAVSSGASPAMETTASEPGGSAEVAEQRPSVPTASATPAESTGEETGRAAPAVIPSIPDGDSSEGGPAAEPAPDARGAEATHDDVAASAAVPAPFEEPEPSPFSTGGQSSAVGQPLVPSELEEAPGEGAIMAGGASIPPTAPPPEGRADEATGESAAADGGEGAAGRVPDGTAAEERTGDERH